jgi:hypothetical protein
MVDQQVVATVMLNKQHVEDQYINYKQHHGGILPHPSRQIDPLVDPYGRKKKGEGPC